MSTIPDLLRLAPGVDVAQINANKWAVSVRGLQRPLREQAARPGRWSQHVQPDLLGRVLGLRRPDVRRCRSNRGDPRPGRSPVGRQRGERRHQYRHQSSGRHPGRTGPCRRGPSSASRAPSATAALSTRPATACIRNGRDGSNRSSRRACRRLTGRTASGPDFAPTGRRRPAPLRSKATYRWGRCTRCGRISIRGRFSQGLLATEASDTQGGHLLGRWTRTGAGGASLQVQSFIDIEGRTEPVGRYDRRAFDIDTQYHTILGARHDLVAGAGYRVSDDTFAGGVGLSLTPAENKSSLLSAFVQDEVALIDRRLAVTLGSQVQYDSDSGAGVQPTARALWKALPHQRLWVATSRALRTPSLYERRMRLDFPPVPGPGGLPLFVTARGNPAAETESLVDVEGGYRLEVGTTASIDVTGFAGRYDHLRTQEPPIPSSCSFPRHTSWSLHNSATFYRLGRVDSRSQGIGHRSRHCASMPATPPSVSRRSLRRRASIPPPHGRRQRATDAVAMAVDVFAGVASDAERRPLLRRSARARRRERLHSRRHRRRMAADPSRVGRGGRPEPIQSCARRVVRRRRAAAGHAGSSQCDRASALDVLRMSFPHRRVRPPAVASVALAATLIASPWLAASSGADPVPAVAVKAAFLYNFARFAEWPASVRQRPDCRLHRRRRRDCRCAGRHDSRADHRRPCARRRAAPGQRHLANLPAAVHCRG